MKYIFLLSIALIGQASIAQDTSNKNLNSSIGVIAGPFLPSQISGVTEVMQVTGLRLGSNTKFGNFEAEGWLANGSGVSYQSVLVNYRLDVPSDILMVHALAGIHVDAYRMASAKTGSGGGWQIGGGAETKIAGPFSIRSDFEYRFGPGDSLLVLLSIMMGF